MEQAQGNASSTPGAILVKRFELALERLQGAYADAYADAEDRGDAKRALKDARDALLAALASLPRETPDIDPVKAAFDAWVRRTNTRFAPYMGSVDDAFAEWQRCYPDEVAAAIAKATGAAA